MFQGEDMKKITVLILALCLAVPAQAWHLFPVKEKIVEVPKTNYTAYAITGVAVGAIALVIVVAEFKFCNNEKNGIQTDAQICTKIRNSLDVPTIYEETISVPENMDEEEALKGFY
jgi:ABC-type anion transport system duplicated permease subunit